MKNDETLAKLLNAAKHEFTRAGMELDDVQWYIERAYLLGRMDEKMDVVLKNRNDKN